MLEDLESIFYSTLINITSALKVHDHKNQMTGSIILYDLYTIILPFIKYRISFKDILNMLMHISCGYA